jgi:two-component system, NtrC family, response regulator AtoC
LRLKNALKEHYDFKKLIKGSSRELEQVFDLMGKAVQTHINVSLSGEPGTGKDLVAKGIHYNSARSGHPYVIMNMAAIPEDQIGDGLFGSEVDELSATGSRKPGMLEQANGGTLFLDGVEYLSLNDQARLMRVMQDQEMVPPGCSEPTFINVRIISASRKNLATLVKEGSFRQDLYFHLLGLPIEIPPLRQRGNDIMLLAKYFVNDFCKHNDMASKSIADDAKKRLMTYHFPGNIRELKAMMEQACVMSNHEMIKAVHLNLNIDENIANLLSTEKTLEAYQFDIIKYFLNKYNQNVRLVSEKLGVGKSTIYRIVQKKEFQNR